VMASLPRQGNMPIGLLKFWGTDYYGQVECSKS
jgi:hypothetical protein